MTLYSQQGGVIELKISVSKILLDPRQEDNKTERFSFYKLKKKEKLKKPHRTIALLAHSSRKITEY